jgi:hypothetical protein
MENIQKYKQFLNEETESLKEFRVQALLVISNQHELMKTDVLSNIRAVEGITRVHVDQNISKTFYEISKVTIKVNVAPFGVAPLAHIFNQIRKDIIAITGVRRFTYISRPERI